MDILLDYIYIEIEILKKKIEIFYKNRKTCYWYFWMKKQNRTIVKIEKKNYENYF